MHTCSFQLASDPNNQVYSMSSEAKQTNIKTTMSYILCFGICIISSCLRRCYYSPTHCNSELFDRFG